MALMLRKWKADEPRAFTVPSKKINEGQDVTTFLVSQAYRDITVFLVQLNRAMFPQKEETDSPGQAGVRVFDSNSSYLGLSEAVTKVRNIIEALESVVDEVPLDPGPRRFGNVAFRKWYALVENRTSTLLSEHLPSSVLDFPHTTQHDALVELRSYLLGSFGSSQRLDYGTGHELSFLAFLAGIWKLGGFSPSEEGNEERAIVIGILGPYVT